MQPVTLKRSVRIKIFLREYYFAGGPPMFVLRAFAGPFIICSSLLFYGLPKKFLIAYSGLAVSFGIYYTLKPLVAILSKKIISPPFW